VLKLRSLLPMWRWQWGLLESHGRLD
jgi:hypothetical protein